MSSQQLTQQAFKLFHRLGNQTEYNIPGSERERLIKAKNRAYRRYLRRMGF
jgi:hypothetical protein